MTIIYQNHRQRREGIEDVVWLEGHVDIRWSRRSYDFSQESLTALTTDAPDGTTGPVAR